MCWHHCSGRCCHSAYSHRSRRWCVLPPWIHIRRRCGGSCHVSSSTVPAAGQSVHVRVLVRRGCIRRLVHCGFLILCCRFHSIGSCCCRCCCSPVSEDWRLLLLASASVRTCFPLCCVRHFLFDLLLHTLLCAQAFDDLVNHGGGIGLAVEAQGIGGYDLLTALDVALRFFEMRFEGCPGFFILRSAVPLSDVAREDGGSGDDDQSDVD